MPNRKKISEVFTPRKPTVNEQMYIQRPELERRLLRSIQGTKNTLLFGESGNGKSWLFKHALTNAGIPFIVANSSNASRLNSITNEICSSISQSSKPIKVGYSETKSVGIAATNIKHESNYELRKEEPLLSAFKEYHSQHKKGVLKVIVIDNLETIFDSEEKMNELADIIILLDDERYAKYNIKFLIVGVPSGVLAYFSRTKNLESVSNRIDEIQKVSSLSKDQVLSLVRRGLVEFLQAKISDKQLLNLSAHIYNSTMGIAQYVHEFCECLAYEIEQDGWSYNDSLRVRAEEEWLLKSFRKCYQLIDENLNNRGTEISRRNQVIYTIGKVEIHQFDTSIIDGLVRRYFPETIPATNMGIGSILTKLASGNKPLLKRNGTGSYSVIDPLYIMCIRLMLIVNTETGRVDKKYFIAFS